MERVVLRAAVVLVGVVMTEGDDRTLVQQGVAVFGDDDVNALGLQRADPVDSRARTRRVGVSRTGHTETILTVQDQNTVDGARVQTQAIQGTVVPSGTEGVFKLATDGTSSGPLMDAVPQDTAK